MTFFIRVELIEQTLVERTIAMFEYSIRRLLTLLNARSVAALVVISQVLFVAPTLARVPTITYVEILPQTRITSTSGSSTNITTLTNSVPVGQNIHISTIAYITSGAGLMDLNVEFRTGNSVKFSTNLVGVSATRSCTYTQLTSDKVGYNKWDLDCWIYNSSPTVIDRISFRWDNWQSSPYIQSFLMFDGAALDTTAPTTSTATVSSAGTTVTLGMSETLGSSTPVASAFAVTVDGVATTPTGVSISGSNVALTLPTAIEAGSTVSVAYTKPSSGNVLEDAAGNDMASFDTAGSITATNSSTVDTLQPTVLITGPTGVVTTAFSVTITFSENVTNFDASDVVVTHGAKSSFTGSGTSYSVVITPQVGSLVTVAVGANAAQDNAGNGNVAATSLTVNAGSPETEFETHLNDIRSQIQSVALQVIRTNVSETATFMSSARDRFVSGRRNDGPMSILSSRNSIPFDIDGSTSVSTRSADINGSFFGQFGNFDGTYRRITSGDFNLQRVEDGNTTAALSGRVAWEYLTSDTTMLGWFVGAEYAQSDMNGTFTGDQTSFGASIGGYFVSELQDQLYLDGHLALKQSEHDLTLSNGTLDLESIYHSTTVLSGLTLTGVSAIDESSELWPTLSINAARSDLGTIGFTGTARGITDSTLSMDGGAVSYADVSVAPKYRAAMDGQTLANSLMVATVTPKAMCEYTELSGSSSRNCGTGIALGILGTTEDGKGSIELELGLDSIGGATRHSLALSADLRF